MMVEPRLTPEQVVALVSVMERVSGAENWRVLLPIVDELARAMRVYQERKSDEPGA